jgi:hypothetical protein
MEVWCVARGLGAGNRGRFTDKRDVSSTSGFQFLMSDTFLRFLGYDGGERNTIANNRPVVFNTLTHAVVSWSINNAPKLYMNGTECTYSTSTSVSTPTDDTAQSFLIGNWSGRTTTWDGQIYAVRIYRNIALSAANVTTLYNSGVMTKQSNPLGNATAEYLFHEGTGSTLTDSISAVNGTITGADWSNTGWRDGSSMDMFRSLY